MIEAAEREQLLRIYAEPGLSWWSAPRRMSQSRPRFRAISKLRATGLCQ
jgi:hypothetical protein